LILLPFFIFENKPCVYYYQVLLLLLDDKEGNVRRSLAFHSQGLLPSVSLYTLGTKLVPKERHSIVCRSTQKHEFVLTWVSGLHSNTEVFSFTIIGQGHDGSARAVDLKLPVTYICELLLVNMALKILEPSEIRVGFFLLRL